jgi:ribose-phosphate pyrophosphokinase
MKYVINSYPDGTQYVKVTEFSDNLEFRINSYLDLWTLRQIKDVCDYNKQEVNLHVACLLDAQADRRFNPDESSGLKLVCEFINSMKFKSVSVFHPHNPEVVEALLDGVTIMDNSKFISSILSKIVLIKENEYNSYSINKTYKNLILFSSDAGGFKPLMKLCDKIQWKDEVYAASKSRKYVDGKSILVQEIDRQDFGGKDILIVDDICVYGGTFIGLANMLRERNCGKLYLAVSHMTVRTPNPLLFKSFDKVFITNSKGFDYFDENYKHPENLFIIS